MKVYYYYSLAKMMSALSREATILHEITVKMSSTTKKVFIILKLGYAISVHQYQLFYYIKFSLPLNVI